MAMMSMMNNSLKRYKKGWHLLPFFYAETAEIPGLPGPDEARKDKQAKVVLRTSFHHFCLLVWRGEAKPSRRPLASEERQASISPLMLACLSMGYVA